MSDKPKPPRLRPKRRKVGPADFTRVIADASAKVARAKTDAFMARLEAIDTILEDAEPYDVLMACAQAFANAMPLCCEAHEDEFKTEFLQILSDCVDQERDVADAAEPEGDGGAPQVH
jgi:hypothetical protein